jgi:hypothetical protein
MGSGESEGLPVFGAVAVQADDQFALVQADECLAVRVLQTRHPERLGELRPSGLHVLGKAGEEGVASGIRRPSAR